MQHTDFTADTIYPLTKGSVGTVQLGTALNVVTAPEVIARLTNIEAGMASMQNSILAMGATLDAMRGMMALTGMSFF